MVGDDEVNEHHCCCSDFETSSVRISNSRDQLTCSSYVLHVFVVGFHHKKGCQVEYCYPALNGKQSGITDNDLPDQWQHLPSLALPDGAHNVEKAISSVGHQIGAKLGGWWGSSAEDYRGKEDGEDSNSQIEVASEAEISTKIYSDLETDEWGFPLSIFTNVDEAGEIQIDILDADLKKQLALTTADLRFANLIVKNVAPDTGNVFVDATGWEGGEEWIRLQFKSYLLSLIATATQSDQSLKEDFNELFLDAWRSTHNFKVWNSGNYPCLRNAVAGHPFAGQLGVSDVRLRFYHSVQSSHQGRKLAKAATETGKYVSLTGKAVKSRLSGLFWTDMG